ncbi:MAG: VTT domain-containing protein [Sulfuriferula multivorans]|uniref:TVP38/TMEM64 family membrane protein n=1 Tax=Sulfuriferula multivorans TaxID=1559896 RepID=A0A7C9K957_9PROT|nr:VTT domain-containing protein [Sulfuriferula multivorans]
MAPPSQHTARFFFRVASHGLLVGFLLTVLVASAFASGLDLPGDLRGVQQWLIGLLPLDQASWALATVLTLSVAGGVLGLPVTLMIALCAMLFGAVPGMLYSLSGCLAGAMLAYAVAFRIDPAGRVLSTKPARLIHQRLRRGGLTAILLLRLFPLIPFTLVNLAAGAIRVRWRDYVIGTLLGMLPSIVLISLVMGRLHTVSGRLTAPHASIALIALLMVLLAAVVGPMLARRHSLMTGRLLPTQELPLRL